MSAWLGLHNPERHETHLVIPSWGNCIDCETACMWDDPCRCCLAVALAGVAQLGGAG